MRLFVGLELDEGVRKAAAAVAARLETRLAEVARDFKARWIPDSNLHITIWFFGEIADEAAAVLIEQLRAPLRVSPFELAVRGCGAFPRSGPPRVLWIGTAEGTAGMGEAHAALARRLATLGYLPEDALVFTARDAGASEGPRPRSPGGAPGAWRRSGGLRAHRRRCADPVSQPLVAAWRRLRAAAASTIGLMWPILLGYLAGSVPFAFLLARRAGIDVRFAGSGNVGAANVLRTTGTGGARSWSWRSTSPRERWRSRWRSVAHAGVTLTALAAAAAVVGHIYPVWLRFHGGKGVAVAAGVFAVLTPIATAVAAGLFLVIVWVTRYVSLGSIAATVALPPAAWITGEPTAVVRRRGRYRRADSVPPSRQHPAPARGHRAADGGAGDERADSPFSGAGSWGTALAVHLGRIGHEVTPVGAGSGAGRRRSSGRDTTRATCRSSPCRRPVSLHGGSAAARSMARAFVVFALPSHGLRAVAREAAPLAGARRGA